MPISVNSLSQQELNILATTNTSTHIIALKNEGGAQKIVAISRDEITCWQKFLRIFNRGKFADTQIHLCDITNHLNKYNWAEARANPAYSKVCSLANKALYHKWEESLYVNVAVAAVDKRVEFAQYQEGKLLNRHTVLQNVKWNPEMQVKHLNALLAKNYQNSNVRIEDANHHVMSRETNLDVNGLNAAQLYVEQHMPVRTQYVYIHNTQHCHPANQACPQRA